MQLVDWKPSWPQRRLSRSPNVEWLRACALEWSEFVCFCTSTCWLTCRQWSNWRHTRLRLRGKFPDSRGKSVWSFYYRHPIGRWKVRKTEGVSAKSFSWRGSTTAHRKYHAKIARFADAALTGINGFFGTVGAAAEENRRPVWRAIFCMELVRAFILVKVSL